MLRSVLLFQGESSHFVGFPEGLSSGKEAQPGSGGRTPLGWGWSHSVTALNPILSTWDTISMTDPRVYMRWALKSTDDNTEAQVACGHKG